MITEKTLYLVSEFLDDPEVAVSNLAGQFFAARVPVTCTIDPKGDPASGDPGPILLNWDIDPADCVISHPEAEEDPVLFPHLQELFTKLANDELHKYGIGAFE